jgi:mRNA-degrading endonuclease RelE of RelBE toxin-antitoxin system
VFRAPIRRALAALAEQPHPDQAVVWGGSGIYRLHLPGIWILYEVNEDAETVYVINVAVTK